MQTTINRLKREVITDLRVEDEQELKSKIRAIIRSIQSEQVTIARATTNIQKYQKDLKELQEPAPISTDILG